MFGKEELEETIESLREFHDEKVDFVYLGCPHTTLYEIAKIYSDAGGKEKSYKDVYFKLYTQYGIRENARRLGYIDVIEKAGGKVCGYLLLQYGLFKQSYHADRFCQTSPLRQRNH